MNFVDLVNGSPEGILWQTETIDGVKDQGPLLLAICWWHMASTEISRTRRRKQRDRIKHTSLLVKTTKYITIFEKCRCLTLWFIVLRFTNIKICFRDFPKVNHDKSCNWDAILLHLADKNFIGNTFLTRQFCEGLMLIDPSVNCFSISGSMGLSGVYQWNSFLFSIT